MQTSAVCLHFLPYFSATRTVHSSLNRSILSLDPYLPPFLLLVAPWHAVRSYRTHLEVRDTIWLVAQPSSVGLVAEVFGVYPEYEVLHSEGFSTLHSHSIWACIFYYRNRYQIFSNVIFLILYFGSRTYFCGNTSIFLFRVEEWRGFCAILYSYILATCPANILDLITLTILG